jgi:curved DNA-binding protein CbpA
MVQTSHYATLGLPRNATTAQIRAAYRTLARRYHPDLHPDDPAAEDTLKRINAAYAVLSDVDKRRSYDVIGTDWEDTLRDDTELRQATGFAARPAGSTPPPVTPRPSSDLWRPARAEWAADLNLIRSMKLAIVSMLLIAFALLGLQVPHHSGSSGSAAPPDTESARRVRAMYDLNAALARFDRELLEGGPQEWKRVCGVTDSEFIEHTVRPNYERRYREVGQAVVEQIGRAQTAGVFARGLTPDDQAALRELVPLRDELQAMLSRGPILDCRSELGLYDLQWQGQVTRAATRCLSKLIRSQPG